MIAFIIAPFLLALLIFIYICALKQIHGYVFFGKYVIEAVFGVILFGGFLCIILGLLISNIEIQRLFTRLGYFWLGFILYLFIGIIIALVCRIVIRLCIKEKDYDIKNVKLFTFLFVGIFTVFMFIYGVTNAHDLRITKYDVVSNKQSNIDNLNIVLIADLHMGYNVGVKEIEDMANKINSLNPDVVVLAGDIFDNEYSAVEQPKKMLEILNSIESKYGKYAIYGNHDIEEKLIVGFSIDPRKDTKAKAKASSEMIDFINNSGFKLLYDSAELIEDSVYIYGRPDEEKINLGNNTRIDAKDITSNLDKQKTIICLDHEPSELQQLADAGVDLDLSGHTHNGQFWPGTISIKWFWDNAYGLKQIDNMTSIVTSGVGLYGFNLRTGCYPEIVNINLTFKK